MTATVTIGAKAATTSITNGRSWIRSAAAVVALILLVVVARRVIVPPFASLRHPQWLWLPVAVSAKVISFGAFTSLQRLTLARGGVVMPVLQSTSIALASNALSVTVPLAGTVSSAAFTAQQYAKRGACSALITWTFAVTALVSTAMFAVIVGAGGLVSGDSSVAIAGAATAGIGLVPTLVLFAALRTTARRAALARLVTSLLVMSKRVLRRRKDDAGVAARDTIEQLATFHVGRRLGSQVLAMSLLNWLAEIGCLAAAIEFVGQPVPWRSLVLVYAAAVGASTIGVTPAGIGVVETAIAAALTAAGLPGVTAVAAAIVYRAVSCWLVAAIGWVTLARLRSVDGARRQPGGDVQVLSRFRAQSRPRLLRSQVSITQGEIDVQHDH